MFAIPSRRASRRGDAAVRPEPCTVIRSFIAALDRCEAILAQPARRRARRRGDGGVRQNAA